MISSKKEEPKANRPRSVFSDTDKIVVMTERNPYRNGSKAWHTYQCILQAVSVFAFKTLCYKSGGKADPVYLGHAIRAGHVILEKEL